LVNGRAEAWLNVNEGLGIQSFMRSSAVTNLAGFLKQRDKNLKGLLWSLILTPDFAKFPA